MARKTKTQQIEEALAAKGLKGSIYYMPVFPGGPTYWHIEIDTRDIALRGVYNEIAAPFDSAMKEISQAYIGYDFCPVCSIGINRDEERMGFCQNCRSSFDPPKP